MYVYSPTKTKKALHMTTLTTETLRPTIDQSTADLQEEFTQASEFVIEGIQDSPAFMQKLSESGVPYDDNDEGYWSTVRSVGLNTVDRGLAGPVESRKAKVFAVAASAPNFIYKQLWLSHDAETKKKTGLPVLDRDMNSEFKTHASDFNNRVRDLIAIDPAVNFNTLRSSISEAARNGIYDNVASPQEIEKMINTVLVGVRAELGFEQKLDALGEDYQRGTIAEDKMGIDYRMGGTLIDIKASMNKLLEAGIPESDKSYIINRGKVVLLPFEYPQDYNGTFLINKDVLIARADALAQQLERAKRDLRKTN